MTRPLGSPQVEADGVEHREMLRRVAGPTRRVSSSMTPEEWRVRLLTMRKAPREGAFARETDWHVLRRSVERARERGVALKRSITVWDIDVSGDCQSAGTFVRWARKSPELIQRDAHKAAVTQASADEAARLLVEDYTFVPLPGRPPLRSSYAIPGLASWLIVAVTHFRCRKCERCVKDKQRSWFGRAMTETEQSQRTWFGTITLRPEAYFRMEQLARKRARDRSLSWDEMSSDERFAQVDWQIKSELQRWMKRVRMQARGSSIKYLLVCEAHKSGRPHYHCLVHERIGTAKVPARTLKGQWPHGFTDFELLKDPKRAGYVCKYIGKTMRARVRASNRYGERSVAIVNEVNVVLGAPWAPTPSPTLQASEASASANAAEGGEKGNFAPRCSCDCCTMRAASRASSVEAGLSNADGLVKKREGPEVMPAQSAVECSMRALDQR